MWIKKSNKWYKKDNNLSLENFNTIKQELFKTRYYSKCFSGSTYTLLSDFNNIYNIDENNNTYFISDSNNVNNIPLNTNRIEINKDNYDEIFNNYILNDNMSLLNYYNPNELKENINTFTVDLCTIEKLDISKIKLPYKIDDIFLKNGNFILIKDQYTDINIDNSITDVEAYFKSIKVSNYEFISNNILNKTYRYYNSENGIYKIENNNLVKIETNYNNLIVYVKDGISNNNKSYLLSKLLLGYFPNEGDNLYFKETETYLMRNKLDYTNIYDLSYNDSIISKATNYYDDVLGVNISLPERLVTVGEYGTIIVTQMVDYLEPLSHHIENPYKYNLKSITETETYYWICGDMNTILKMNKNTLVITKVSEYGITNLNKINFIDNENGFCVGDKGFMLFTKNGGKIWENLKIDNIQNSLNNLTFISNNKVMVVGDNGTFIELNYTNNKWVVYKRKPFEVIDNNRYNSYDDIINIHQVNQNLFLVAKNRFVIYNIETESYTFENITYDVTNTFIYDNYLIIISDNLYKYNLTSKEISLFVDITSIYLNNSKLKSGVINDNDTLGKNIFICGDRSTIAYANFISMSETITVTLINDEYNSSFIKMPSMLYLDYDIASKTNFFDKNGEYILPIVEKIDIPTELELFEFNDDVLEKKWLHYFKNSIKQYKFNNEISEENVVFPNFTFRLSTSNQTVNSTNNVNSKSEYKKFITNVDNYDKVYYSNQLIINENFNTNYDTLFYNNIILKTWNTIDVSVGDVINISNSTFNDNLIVNSIYYYIKYSGETEYNYIDLDSVPPSLPIGSELKIYLLFINDYTSSLINDLVISNLSFTNLSLFSTVTEFQNNFKKHIISKAYTLDVENNQFIIKPLYNQYTAYYDLEIDIKINYALDYHIVYDDIKKMFGYGADYNIYSMLKNINYDVFNDKVLSIMPKYVNLLANSNNSQNDDNIYIDTSIETNKLSFGKNLKFYYDTLFINTFVDINLYHSGGVYTDTQMLIIDKKEIDGRYFLFFDKKITADVVINTIDILSRNELSQISSDLNLLNNINKTFRVQSNDGINSFNTNNKINYKFNTDSYKNILLSDFDIRNNITAIIYTNHQNDLCMNVVKLKKEHLFNVNSFYVSNSESYSNKLSINLNNNEEILKIGDFIYIYYKTDKMIEYSNMYNGYHSIIEVIDRNNYVLDTNYVSTYSKSLSLGDVIIKKIDFDPYLNYVPVDIYRIGNDNISNGIEVSVSDVQYKDNKFNLNTLNLNNFRINFVDNINIDVISKKYSWFLEGEYKNCVIGEKNNTLIWYSGIWECGRWFGDIWYSGTWVDGDWYSGVKYSYKVVYDGVNVKVDEKNSIIDNNIWENGRWFNGVWNNGIWNNGTVKNITWNDGVWNDGVFENGVWNNGNFNGGLWINGLWNNGTFKPEYKTSIWLDGQFIDGNFDGLWYGGRFGAYNTMPNFGYNSNSSKVSIWENGVWVNGNLLSSAKLNDSKELIKSEQNTNTVFKLGNFYNGNIYGAIIYNINILKSNIYGAIFEDIFINEILSDNRISIIGEFRFNVGDTITIIDNEVNNEYSILGSNQNPVSYIILDVNIENNKTTLKLNKEIDDILITYNTLNIALKTLKIVSKINGSEIHSALIYNSIISNSKVNSTLMVNGVVNENVIWGN